MAGSRVRHWRRLGLSLLFGSSAMLATLTCGQDILPPAGAPNLDLIVTKGVNKTTAQEGDTLVWTVTVTNAGPIAATRVLAGDTVPSAVTRVSASATVGTYATNGVWTIGSLAVGANAQLTLTATINTGTAGTNLLNRAGALSSDLNDSVPSNNIASTTTAVTAAGLNNLVFTTQPANTTAGTGFGVVVKAQNGSGGTVTGFTGNVTVAITSGTGTAQAHLAGTATVAAVAGVATFAGLAIDSAGNGYSLQATATGLNAGTSTTFNITAGAASQLKFTTQPPGTTAGAAFGAVVKAQDSQGNIATSFTGNVTVAIGTNPGSGTLSGTKSVAAVAGVATFSGLSIDKAGTGYTLTAGATGLTSGTSAAFNITAGAATQLAFTTQPANVTAGLAFGTVVTARDAQGNTATGFTGSVTVAITSGTGTSGAHLTGTTAVASVAGVTTFSNLAIDSVGSGYTLTATATGLSSATSAALSVAAATSSTEPSYSSGTQTLLFSDNFDSYATFANVIAGGWLGLNGGTTQDFSTDPVNGANLVINDTLLGVVGKAIRLKYDGISTGSGQEVHDWERTAGLGSASLAAQVGHTLYISYWFRIVPATGYHLDTDNGSTSNGHIVKVKWLELVKSTGGGERAQFNTSYSVAVGDTPHIGWSGTGTLWQFFANGGGTTPSQAEQVRAPWAYQGQGQWHRVTHKYVTQSATGARDGVAQMWYDGTLIVSVRLADVNVTVPGGQGIDNHTGVAPAWCTTADLDGFYVNDPVSRFRLGSVQTASLWPFSIDIDNFMVWRD